MKSSAKTFTQIPSSTKSTLATQSPMTKYVELLKASWIEVKVITWLWFGWLATGKIHILAGAAGTGKTNLALWMAAIISIGSKGGRSWPGNDYAPAGHVIIWTGEDGVEDTILPRLRAQGANLENIHIVWGAMEHGRSRPFNFATDLEELSAQMERVGTVMLVIIDSIVQAVAGDSNKNSEVRQALAPLVDLAERHNCAILGITHITKGSKNKDPLDRVAGSMAFGAVARLVMITAKIKSEPPCDGLPGNCVLVRAKSNIGADDGGFKYCIESTEFEDPAGTISTSRIKINELPLQGSAREILKFAESDTTEGKISKVDKAAEFLIGMLINGPRPFPEIESQAIAAVINMSAIERAKTKLGIRSEKQTGAGQFSPYFWSLPDASNNTMQPHLFGTNNSTFSVFTPAPPRSARSAPFAASAAPAVPVSAKEMDAAPAAPEVPVRGDSEGSSVSAEEEKAEATEHKTSRDEYATAYAAAHKAAYSALIATHDPDKAVAVDAATYAAYAATRNEGVADEAIQVAVSDAWDEFNEV